MATIFLLPLFALCAAVGTGIRAIASTHDSARRRRIGTFAVNVLGAFALGVISGMEEDGLILLGIALLGSLTTFSSFIGQVVEAWDAGERQTAIGYLTLSIMGGLLAAWTGIELSSAI